MTVKVQTLADGLQLTVRPVINWLILCSQLLVALILFGVGLEPTLEQMRFGSVQAGDTTGKGVIALIFAAILVLVLYNCLKMLLGYERVIVRRSELLIQSWLAGVNLSARTFPNNTVENLRYEEWSGGRAGQQRAIRFESAGETVTFGRQADSSDCYEVIDQMESVFRFPTSKADDDQPGDDDQLAPGVIKW